MPYIFPKRYLRSGDVMDPEDLNQDFTPAQERLDGHIDSVNLDAASFKSGVTVAAGAYYEPYYKSVEHDVGFASTGSPRSVSSPNFVEMDGTTKRTHYPTDDDGSVFVVPNDGSWVAVPGKDVDNSLMIEPTTGSSVLWVTAYVQYVWQGFFEPKFSDSGSTITSESDFYDLGQWPNDDHPFGYPMFEGSASFERKHPNQGGWHHRSRGERAAKVQFAIRINGRVVTRSITGKDELEEKVYTGLKAGYNKAKSAAQRDAVSGVSHEDDEESAKAGQKLTAPLASAPGPEVMALRFGAAVPVSPGDHTVEIIVRRLPGPGGRPRTRGDYVGVFTRRLFCLDLKNIPPASDERADLPTIPDFDSELIVTGELLETQTAASLRDRFNNVRRNDIFRHSLPNTHLPSKVSFVGVSTIQPETAKNGNLYWSRGRSTAQWPGWPGGTKTGSTGSRNSSDHVVTQRGAGWNGLAGSDFSDDDTGAGWYMLDDGTSGGEKLQIDKSASATSPLNLTTDDVLMVQADVFLRCIAPQAQQWVKDLDVGESDSWTWTLNWHQIHKYLDIFAAFAIGYYDTDQDKWIIASQFRPAWTNHYNWFGRGPFYQCTKTTTDTVYGDFGVDLLDFTEAEIYEMAESGTSEGSLPTPALVDLRGSRTQNLYQFTNIPLFWVIKDTEVNINKLAVFCCSTTPNHNVYSGAPPGTPGVTGYAQPPRGAIGSIITRWGRSSLTAIKFKK